MFDVDKGRKPASFLRLRTYGQCLGRFPRGLWAKNLHDSASWKSADAKSSIDQNVPGRNDIDIDNLLIAEAHDRAFAVVFCDLLNRQVEVFISCCSDFVFAGFLLGFRRHIKRL